MRKRDDVVLAADDEVSGMSITSNQRFVLAAVMALASCRTSLPPYPGPSALETGHWTMIRADPPTYYPRGMSKDHPTFVGDGFWIVAGDPAGSRFFVPVRGYGKFTRTELEGEAKAAIHPDELKRQGRRKMLRELAGAFADAAGTAASGM